jgi:acyl dehydratase
MHGSVYVGQTLRFLKPVFTNSCVRAKIEVVQVEKRKRGHLLTCSTTVHILHDDDDVSVPVLAVTGEAQVLVPFA